jgi:TPR repeat protein
MCMMKSVGSLFFAFAVALAMLVPAKAARLDSAVRSGDFPRAVKSVGPAAERGDARAQAHLGFMYQYGRGVPQNYRLAYYWYRRGAEQGNAAAQHLLGLLYDKGQGTPTDHVLAHMWLSLAAAATKGAEHEDNVRLRDAVASKMSLGQLSDAQSLAVSWVPKPER